MKNLILLTMIFVGNNIFACQSDSLPKQQKSKATHIHIHTQSVDSAKKIQKVRAGEGNTKPKIVNILATLPKY